MSPIEAAHLRLMSTLPVRTHHQGAAEDRRGENMRAGLHWRAKRKTKITQARVLRRKGAGGWNREALLIDGITYPSFRRAREALKIGNLKLLDWVSSGRARKVTA